MSEAKGMQKMANAELESACKLSARNTENLAMAKASAACATAKEKYDDSAGNAKNVGKKDAKAAYVKLTEEARVMGTGTTADGSQNSVLASASKDENEASFKAAAARCDNLVGAPKDSCI